MPTPPAREWWLAAARSMEPCAPVPPSRLHPPAPRPTRLCLACAGATLPSSAMWAPTCRKVLLHQRPPSHTRMHVPCAPHPAAPRWQAAPRPGNSLALSRHRLDCRLAFGFRPVAGTPQPTVCRRFVRDGTRALLIPRDCGSSSCPLLSAFATAHLSPPGRVHSPVIGSLIAAPHRPLCLLCVTRCMAPPGTLKAAVAEYAFQRAVASCGGAPTHNTHLMFACSCHAA